jgi:hypothetical protein
VIFAAASGLFAGMLHVVSGPDHLSAVAPLAARRAGAPWRTGFRWGLGHSAGVVAVAVAAHALRETLPLSAVSQWGERLVGLTLLVIGLWSLRQAFGARPRRHSHGPSGHGGVAKAAFGVGALHGIAGSSHFIGVLPALVFPTAAQSAAYLCGFTAGTIGAMIVFAGALGWVAGRMENRAAGVRGLLAGCGFAAVGIGGWWLAGGGA